MHFCQDEAFTLMMAIQNGPRNIWQFVLGWVEDKLSGCWLDEDMRSWRQSKVDMEELWWDKERRRWARPVWVEIE